MLAVRSFAGSDIPSLLRSTSVTMSDAPGLVVTGRAVALKRMCSLVHDLGVRAASHCSGVCVGLMTLYHSLCVRACALNHSPSV